MGTIDLKLNIHKIVEGIQERTNITNTLRLSKSKGIR
jgi:hypothetical protein